MLLPPSSFRSVLTRRSLLAGAGGLIAAGTGLAPSPARAALKLDISGGTPQPIPIAITDFVGEVEQGRAITGVISADLKRSGLFAPIDPKAFVEQISNPDMPRFQDWRVINAQALVTGRVARQQDGRFQVIFRLWDVFAGQVDFFAPQMYWVEAHNPADQLANCLKEYRARWPGKKVAPVGAAYQENGWRATPGEIKEFAEAVQTAGLSGYSFWEWNNAIRYGLWDTVAGLEVETGEDAEPAPTRATVRTAVLNFRSAPVVDAKNIITGLPRGAAVELVNLVTDAAGNTWAQVNLSGWVAVKYRGSTLAELS